MNYHVLNLINELKKYIGDFLGREKLIIIGGHPGSGKTTLASSICLASVQQEYRCPGTKRKVL
ncbi:MAG: AAA family ATPase [Desulfurococcaceae archaeon]